MARVRRVKRVKIKIRHHFRPSKRIVLEQGFATSEVKTEDSKYLVTEDGKRITVDE